MKDLREIKMGKITFLKLKIRITKTIKGRRLAKASLLRLFMKLIT